MLSPVRLFLQAYMSKKPIYEHQQKTLMDGMFDVIELLAKNRTKFIAGDRITIADFLLFHEMTNIVYFGLDNEKYKEVKRWYAEVYQVP
jgi:glutathione S-transferase